MQFTATPFPGLFVIEPKVFGDARGFFMETYRRRLFEAHGLDREFVQANHAKSGQAGVLRGLHFQTPPHAQAKLVRVSAGAVYDVVVDLRVGSPTYGAWYGLELSAANFVQLFIPRGFAHGYWTLTPDVEFQYMVDAYYAPDHDAGLVWNDPDLAVTWPGDAPILSAKDAALPRFKDFASPFVYEP
ncbi:MAG: dTDP-4-dehydrorhamnose 3,5-epimerase [Desulfovibrionaceae bacterium]